MTVLDACKGFNQARNTERARQMLASLARIEQFPPRCLTFGPHSGPEYFAYATDRVYAPGGGQRCVSAYNGRYTQTIAPSEQDALQTASCIPMKNGEIDSELRTIKEHSLQQLAEAFTAFGFDPVGLGGEATASHKERRKTKQEEAKKG